MNPLCVESLRTRVSSTGIAACLACPDSYRPSWHGKTMGKLWPPALSYAEREVRQRSSRGIFLSNQAIKAHKPGTLLPPRAGRVGMCGGGCTDRGLDYSCAFSVGPVSPLPELSPCIDVQSVSQPHFLLHKLPSDFPRRQPSWKLAPFPPAKSARRLPVCSHQHGS
jgi:hypothetical protein